MRTSVGFSPRTESGRTGPWVLAVVGVAGAAVAVALRPQDARAAAAQDWSPFVLVAGLLLIGLVADDDGLFAAAGHRLAQVTRSGSALFIGAVILIGGVSAVLNLDTSVAFLTPVLVYTARSRKLGEPALLYGCLLLSNAGSLLLPGSNLTNLIVLGHLRLRPGCGCPRRRRWRSLPSWWHPSSSGRCAAGPLSPPGPSGWCLAWDSLRSFSLRSWS